MIKRPSAIFEYTEDEIRERLAQYNKDMLTDCFEEVIEHVLDTGEFQLGDAAYTIGKDISLHEAVTDYPCLAVGDVIHFIEEQFNVLKGDTSWKEAVTVIINPKEGQPFEIKGGELQW